jgi:hypothetical protein
MEDYETDIIEKHCAEKAARVPVTAYGEDPDGIEELYSSAVEAFGEEKRQMLEEQKAREKKAAEAQNVIEQLRLCRLRLTKCEWMLNEDIPNLESLFNRKIEETQKDLLRVDPYLETFHRGDPLAVDSSGVIEWSKAGYAPSSVHNHAIAQTGKVRDLLAFKYMLETVVPHVKSEVKKRVAYAQRKYDQAQINYEKVFGKKLNAREHK